jgi:hypothetical protein
MDNLSVENISRIWNQLPDQNRQMLHERLFFLALQEVGGIRLEPDTSTRDSSGTAGGVAALRGDEGECLRSRRCRRLCLLYFQVSRVIDGVAVFEGVGA